MKTTTFWNIGYRLLLILLLCSNVSLGQSSPSPVVFEGDTLFIIENRIGAFSAQQRAELVQANVQQLAKLQLVQFDSLTVLVNANSADVMHKNKVITTVSATDTTGTNLSLAELAEEHRMAIRAALIKDYNDFSFGTLAKDIGFFLLALIVFTIVFNVVNRIFDFLRRNLRSLQDTAFFQKNKLAVLFKLITPETEMGILLFILRMLRYTTWIVFLYFYLPFLFSQISFTRGFGETLLEYILQPLRFLASGVIGFLPNLLFIIIIIVAVSYLLKGLKHIAKQVKQEKITIEGFFPDWATPTFNLFRVLIIAFTLVVLFPYLPGAGTDAFQGVSVFIGLLLSLGSAGIISNVISGVILIYMRPFKIGDYVNINATTGSVMSRNLLVTKIRTNKNEEITIPNSILLGGGITNYTAIGQAQGLIVHSSITIGYDVPWVQVHQLLIEAANRTKGIEDTPIPFVLQKSLQDWYVEYEINAHTKLIRQLPQIYSELHGHIQDVFNEAGLEIMSSHYMALRDGNNMAVPTPYLPKDYQVPSFKVDRDKGSKE